MPDDASRQLGETTLAGAWQRRDLGQFPVLRQPIAPGSLYQVRSSVAAHASRAHLDPVLIDQLVLIASELAINTIRHGGGTGLLHLWSEAQHIYLQVADAGPGMSHPDTAGLHRPESGRPGSRGLWVVRTLAEKVNIESSTGGTTVTVRLPARYAIRQA